MKRISDWIFSDKINGVICWTLPGIAVALILFQVTRWTGLILIV